MKTSTYRICKALCAITAVTLLTACGGATSTVDPFVPTRIIGLGDAYNDTGENGTTPSTVRGALAEVGVSTVVGQVAALWNPSATLRSYGDSQYANAATLTAQINGLGTLTAEDLVVITAGTQEFISGDTTAASFLPALKAGVDTLKLKGAKHILIMGVVDLSVAGTGYADPVTFNGNVLAGLTGYADVVRYVNVNRPTAYFPGWVSSATYQVPYCANPGGLTGCAYDTQKDPTNYFLADNLHATPAGNRWLAQYLYNVTAQGWR